MTYLDAAQSIFKWLAKYQIVQKDIAARRKGNLLEFQLQHPLKGTIDVVEPIPKTTYFQSRGIGLVKKESDDYTFSLGVYDYGGIFDPVDHALPGTHYATTHFAWLGAILFHYFRDQQIAEKVKAAIDFHLFTSEHEYFFDDWNYHWDFQNLAFIETYRIMQKELSEVEEGNWMHGIKTWNENQSNNLTNWVAMRAYSILLRYSLFKKYLDKIRFLYRMRLLHKARQDDGCYDDEKNISRPIQYHIYTIALLHRIYMITKDDKLKQRFLDGIGFFLHFVDPDGCFNYVGRGQEQIFGYGAAIYALEAAKLLDKTNAPVYQYHVDKIWNYLIGFKRGAYFPLVLNLRDDGDKFGWYDYHHLTVYNAFLGVWLALAHTLSENTKADVENEIPRKENVFLPATQTVIIQKDKYYLNLSRGLPYYLSEIGISPNYLWFQKVGWIYSCPGGASPHRFGKINKVEHVEKNFFAPLAQFQKNDWLHLKKHVSTTVFTENEVANITTDYGAFIINRTIYLRRANLIFEDEFQFKQDCAFHELRYFNLPVVIDKFKINIHNKNEFHLIFGDQIIVFRFTRNDFPARDFEWLEDIKTAKGLAKVIALRETNLIVTKKTTQKIRYIISNIKSL